MPLFKSPAAQPPVSPTADAYIAAALGLSQLVALQTRCELDIPYGDLPGQALDIYLPDEERRGCPVYINIHGGNWTHGFKEWLGLGAPPVVTAGAIYISLEYRLAGVARFPGPMDDCFAAVAWIYRNIARYGGDPERLFIGGHSAGAHLAAMVTLRRDLYAEYDLPQGVIKACFPYSGIHDLRHSPVYGAAPGTGPGDLLLVSQDDAIAASPICWTEGNTVPFFVSWSERDSQTMLLQAAPFVLALSKAPGRVESRAFPGLDHFYMHLDQMRPGNYHNQVLIAWMQGDPTTTPLPSY